MKCIALVIWLAASTAGLAAAPSVRLDVTCPLCDTVFPTVSEGEGGKVTDRRLDLMPLGTVSPAYPLPVCPNCSFVFFYGPKGKATADELKKCREVVASDAFKKYAGRSSYCLMGVLFEGLQGPDLQIAHFFLKASWQEATDPTRRNEDLQRSLAHLRGFVAAAKEHDETWKTAQVLSGEILRQLQKFDEARQHFDRLRKMPEFRSEVNAQIIDFELQLVEKHDAGPHTLKEILSN